MGVLSYVVIFSYIFKDFNVFYDVSLVIDFFGVFFVVRLFVVDFEGEM